MNRSRYTFRDHALQSGGYRHGDSNPGSSPASPRQAMAHITDVHGRIEAEMVVVDWSEDAVRLSLNADVREVVFERGELEAAGLAVVEAGTRAA